MGPCHRSPHDRARLARSQAFPHVQKNSFSLSCSTIRGRRSRRASQVYCPPAGDTFFHLSASQTQTPGLPERQARIVQAKGSSRMPMLSHPRARTLRNSSHRRKSPHIQGAVPGSARAPSWGRWSPRGHRSGRCSRQHPSGHTPSGWGPPEPPRNRRTWHTTPRATPEDARPRSSVHRVFDMPPSRYSPEHSASAA